MSYEDIARDGGASSEDEIRQMAQMIEEDHRRQWEEDHPQSEGEVMMKLSERVRSITFAFRRTDNRHKSIRKLADEVAQLESQNAALLEALETIQNVADTPYPVDKTWLAHFATEAIRKASK